MSTFKNLANVSFVAMLAIGLAACGGGSSQPEAPPNTAPSLTLGGSASIDEGATGTTGLTVTATDEQGDTVTYQVSDARFDVVGGMLVVVAGAMLDYETESSIAVNITASDGMMSSETMTASVMVANVDDIAPTLTTSGTRGNITEGETGGTGLTFTANDNDMLDNLDFSFNVEGFDVIDLGGGRYELVVTQALDREQMAEVQVVVTVADGTGSMMTPTLTIAVGGVDDTAPMLGMTGTGTIDENATGDTMVYFRPTDADGDEMLTFYVEGNDRTSFQVVPAGFKVYALQVTDAFDYEMSGGMVSVTVTVADSAGLSDTATFNVMVNDLNDNAPMVTLTGTAAIDEEQMGSTGLMVGVEDADSVGDPTTWSVDDTRFEIDADGYLVLKEGLDYDGAMGVMNVTLNVTANDGANDSDPMEVTVTINAVNDNTPVITVDATAQMDRPEGTFDTATPTGVMVSVADGDGDMPSPMVDDSRFTITDGGLMIAAGSMFDYEMMADQSITLTITANDGVNDAMEQTVTVMFTDVNDNAPKLAVTDNQGGEALKVVVRDEGQVSANTPTDHKVVVSDADSHETPTPMVSDGRFTIDDNGYLTIVAGSVFNFEDDADKSIALQITAEDDAGNMADPYTITFNIANVDEPPVIEGERNPTLVMGPYGDGHKDVTTLTATDPDNPDTPYIVRWTDATSAENMASGVWMWDDNEDGDQFTLMMKSGTFLGKGGPAAQVVDDTNTTDTDEEVSYTGYTADDEKTLRRHLVDVDDAELDERAVVRVEQIVDTIETSPELDMYGAAAYTATNTQGTDDTADDTTADYRPTFDHLTNSVIGPDGELLAGTDLGTNITIPSSPSAPMEPDALDIVTDTRAVDVTSGAVKTGQELAIRYRFASDGDADADGDADYNVDVALIDNSGMVLEEYRNAAAHSATLAADTLTASTSSIEVDVGGGTMSYARYGLWSYNNLRMCTTCPQGSSGPAGGGLRGSTAFGLNARPGDLDTQDHVGVWDGTTVAMWGNKATDGSVDSSTLGSSLTGGTAKIAVNFNNNKVQANMSVANHRFEFDGTLNADNLGYSAMVDTTIPGGAGAIANTGGTVGELSTGHTLSLDSADNIHATGTLSGSFYGPPSAAESTVRNAMASAETAGTWQITDVPHVASPDNTSTVVIGAFGATLSGNVRIGSSSVNGTDVLTGIHTGQTGERIGIADDDN